MDPRTKYILDDIAKMKAEGDTDSLNTMRDYWQGFTDGVNVIIKVLDTIKVDMINPVKEALEEDENETSI